MTQEIITYLIVAAAFIFAGWKIFKKLSKKKVKKKPGFKSGEIKMQHTCSDCSAECILRNASPSHIKSNVETCNRNYSQNP